MTQMLTQENNQEKNQDLEHEEWFLAFQNQWFLSKESKVFLPGKDTWFANPLQTAKIVHKAGRSKRVDISKVKIQITKDPELLQQYYDLREREYIREWGFVGYSGQEDEFDRKGNIVLAIEDGKVIAGLRVSIPNTGYLSNEDLEKNFTYKEICKSCGIDLEKVTYVEVSAVVVERVACGALLVRMFSDVIMDCRSGGIKYMFGVSTAGCNRDYRATLKTIGIKSFVVDKIEAPKKSRYNNVSMYPIVVMTTAQT
jgi:hypothetical protein